MSNTIFDNKRCQSSTSAKKFGICDDSERPAKPAYIDIQDGSKWMAVVVNEALHEVTFLAIDHCIEIKRHDGKMEKSCDGALVYESAIVLVELKDRNVSGAGWIKEAEKQLLSTINYFDSDIVTGGFKEKKAYIANRARPDFRQSQSQRMENFFKRTGFVLRIQNRIIL